VAQRAHHVGVPQHARELTATRISAHHLHVARGNPAPVTLGHHEVMIGVRGDLREMGDHERLPVAPAGHRRERLSHARTGLATDPLIDLIKHERGHGIVAREHHLEGEHEARQLAP